MQLYNQNIPSDRRNEIELLIYGARSFFDDYNAELIKNISSAMKKPTRLFPMPIWMLKALAAVVGKQEEVRRLCGSLQVDIEKTKTVLGWQPPVSVEEGIQRTVDWYLSQRRN